MSSRPVCLREGTPEHKADKRGVCGPLPCITRPEEQNPNVRKSYMFQVLSPKLNELLLHTCRMETKHADTGIRGVGTFGIKIGRRTTTRGFSSRQLGPKPDPCNSL